MKVGIATRNPSKIRAVEEMFRIAFGDVQVFPRDADSGIPAQPKEGQILQGAINRARAALDGNDFGVGIEGRIVEINGKMCNTAYCVIMDRTGKYSIGSQPIFELPEIFRNGILSGKEFGIKSKSYEQVWKKFGGFIEKYGYGGGKGIAVLIGEKAEND